MEEKNNNTKTGFVRIILALVTVGICVYSVFALTDTGKSPTKSAEEKVNHEVFSIVGVVPQQLKSKVIYKDGQRRLIVVDYGLTSGYWDGSCCVYTYGYTVMDYTQIMAYGYNFSGQINELKALFGI